MLGGVPPWTGCPKHYVYFLFGIVPYDCQYDTFFETAVLKSTQEFFRRPSALSQKARWPQFTSLFMTPAEVPCNHLETT